jgi:hypothetical protein
VKKPNRGSNLTSNLALLFVLHCICIVVALSFLFGLALSNLYVRPWIERAFDAPKGSKNSIAWPYVAPRVFVAYFPKSDISLRQTILKNLRV